MPDEVGQAKETAVPNDAPLVDLDKFELAVLGILCKTGKCQSSVALAADLFETTEEVEESRVLEWNLIEGLLADLNARGLVTYRLGYQDIFIRIRPTSSAYRLLKITRTWIREAGQYRPSHSVGAEQPIHVGDMTDFRSFSDTAIAMGPAIREDFIDHCVANRDHLETHRAQLIELYGTDDL